MMGQPLYGHLYTLKTWERNDVYAILDLRLGIERLFETSEEPHFICYQSLQRATVWCGSNRRADYLSYADAESSCFGINDDSPFFSSHQLHNFPVDLRPQRSPDVLDRVIFCIAL